MTLSAEQMIKRQSQGSDARAGKEVLLLWAILGEGGGEGVSRAALESKKMLPSDDKSARDSLVQRGLITVETRSSRNESGRPVRGLWMTATAAGRSWAEENLAATPAKSQAAAPVLQAWLKRLSIFLQARDATMAEFLGLDRGAPDHPPPSPPAGDYQAIRARIRDAYLQVTGGRLNARALLSDLRGKLNGIDRAVLDEALCRLHLEEGATLSGLNNPQEITAEIRDAAVDFKGQPMYVLWISK
jgi:hypothetical protein